MNTLYYAKQNKTYSPIYHSRLAGRKHLTIDQDPKHTKYMQ